MSNNVNAVLFLAGLAATTAGAAGIAGAAVAAVVAGTIVMGVAVWPFLTTRKP